MVNNLKMTRILFVIGVILALGCSRSESNYTHIDVVDQGWGVRHEIIKIEPGIKSSDADY